MDQCNSVPLYLVIYNIQKRNNVRSLLMTAAAFGVKVCLMVGQPKFNSEFDGPDIPSQLKTCIKEGTFVIKRLQSWAECEDYLHQNGIRLLGVEIHEDAKPIEAYLADDVKSPIALVMGNEGHGLNKSQMQSCDGFIRVPQHGQGTASLNVNVAASIILQRFHQSGRFKIL
jgi:tRNA G18 (ribose-2'-O)-methylase SpoU